MSSSSGILRALRRSVAALILAGNAGLAAAQEVPVRAEPGSITTVGVRFQVPPGALDAGAQFRIEPAGAVRILSSLAGAPSVAGDAVLVPVTLSVARDHPAGPLTAASVTLRWGDAGSETRLVVLDVAQVRGVRLRVDPAPVRLTPGGSAFIPYELENSGNAVDIVRLFADPGPGWRVARPPEPVAIAPGETLTGAVRVVAADDARPGELRLVTISLADHSATANVPVRVVPSEGLFPGYVQLPATISVAASGLGEGELGPEDLGYGLDAAGPIGERTAILLHYRNAPATAVHAPRQSDFLGERFRVGLLRPTWRLLAGDVSAPASGLLSHYSRGTGFDLGVDRGRLRGDLLLTGRGRETELDGAGHYVRGSASIGTAAGRFGVAGADLRTSQPWRGTGELRARTGSATYQYHGSTHRLEADVGLIQLEAEGSGPVTGPAAEGYYSFSVPRAHLYLRGRTVDVPVPIPAAGSSYLSAGGRLGLLRWLDAEGWAATQAVRAGVADSVWRSESVFGGLRTSGQRGMLRLGAEQRRTRPAEGVAGAAELETRLIGDARVSARSLALDLSASAGEIESEIGPRQTRDARGILSAHGGRGWGWVTLGYSDTGIGPGQFRSDVGGALRFSRVQLDVSASTPVASDWFGHQPRSVRAGASLAVTRNLEVVLGTVYQPDRPAPWLGSIGFRQRIRLPLPIRSPPTAAGRVFEDLNGNGVWDPGEPALGGLGVRFGDYETVSRANGSFAFHSEAAPSAAVHVDPASLPPGMMVLPGGAPAAGANLQVAVVRAATLRVQVILLENGNDDPSNRRPASGALVRVEDPSGRVREGVAGEAGEVTFTALVPGVHRVTLESVPRLDQPITPVSFLVVLGPAEDHAHEIRIPFTPREIRFSTRAAAQGPGGAPADPRASPPPAPEPVELPGAPDATDAPSAPAPAEPAADDQAAAPQAGDRPPARYVLREGAARTPLGGQLQAERLRTAGFEVRLVPDPGGSTVRLVVGSFSARDEAQRVADRLRSAGFPDYLIEPVEAGNDD